LVHGKIDSIEVSNNVARYQPENNFIKHRNNYIRRSNWLPEYQTFFAVLLITLEFST